MVGVGRDRSGEGVEVQASVAPSPLSLTTVPPTLPDDARTDGRLPPHSQTATLDGMPRELHALLFDLSPNPGMHSGHLVVPNPPPPGSKVWPEPPKPWRDVTAGDKIRDAAGKLRTVLAVRVYRGSPAEDVGYDRHAIGRVVTSGRAWLRGE